MKISIVWTIVKCIEMDKIIIIWTCQMDRNGLYQQTFLFPDVYFADSSNLNCFGQQKSVAVLLL